MLIDIIQLISAVILVVLILMQNRGTGLGSAFGGEGNVYRTRRSLEKWLFKGTIVLAFIFLVIALINIIR